MQITKGAAHLAKADPQLAQIIEDIGTIEMPPPAGNFESLVDSIVSQQLSTKAAATIFKRVTLALENEITPQRVLQTDAQTLRNAGLSGQKTKYLGALSEAFLENPKDYENLHLQTDAEVIELLTAIKGIGVWTAQMFLIFTLLREDVFPVGDLGVRRGMERLLFSGEKQPHDVLTQRAEIWAPYRSVASLYLWRSLAK